MSRCARQSASIFPRAGMRSPHFVLIVMYPVECTRATVDCLRIDRFGPANRMCTSTNESLLSLSLSFFVCVFHLAAGGSCVALTVISPVYGSSASAHTTGNGVASTALLTPSPVHYSPFGMPSAASTLSPSGMSSPSLLNSNNQHNSSSSSSPAPPPPPPPPTMTTPTRGLHHQPSIRVGITSPQPVGVCIFVFEKTYKYDMNWKWKYFRYPWFNAGSLTCRVGSWP